MLSADQQRQFALARQSRDSRFDGRFFVAVKTTGIFCRPICPARLPLEKNVSYYLLAQQAIEDGFRPCLRCRPESAPGSYAWLGTSTTVTRALRLLSEDLCSPIVKIAQRLGISERYLHQLVSTQTGLTPKRLQLFSRLLLAKQLLQQSALPIGDVALACGFQSSRSLQQGLKQHFALAPSQIRQQQGPISSSPHTLFMVAKRPYNWPQVRDFLALRAVADVERLDHHSYARSFVIDQQAGWLSATFCEQRMGFSVTIDAQKPQHLHQVLHQLKRQLDVDTDPHFIATALCNSGLPSDKVTPGLRLPGAWSFFEAGVRAILGQQIAVKAAITQLNKIVHSLGEPIPQGRCFPSPQAIAQSDLAMLSMPQARKRALRDFARAVADAPSMPLADEELLAIKGIGPWTLQYIKLRGLSDPDIYLDKDLIINREAQQWPIKSTAAAPWRSYLTLQLWHNAS